MNILDSRECYFMNLWLFLYVILFVYLLLAWLYALHRYICTSYSLKWKTQRVLDDQLVIAIIGFFHSATLNQNNSPLFFNEFLLKQTYICCLFVKTLHWRDKFCGFAMYFRSYAYLLGSIRCCVIVEGECFPFKFSLSNRYRRRAQK